MGIKDRLRRLEGRYGGAGEYRVPLYLDVFFKELENIRRREAGLEPLPYTDEELAYMREASEHLLEEYIPHLLGEEVSGESRAHARQLEAHIRQHLEELSEAERSTQ